MKTQIRRLSILLLFVMLFNFTSYAYSESGGNGEGIKEIEELEGSAGELEVKRRDILEKIDKLEKESDKLSIEAFAENLSKINEEIDEFGQNALEQLEENGSELLEESKTRIQSIQESLNPVEEPENSGEGSENEISKKKINITRVLVDDTGEEEFTEDKIEKEYINAIIPDNVKLKDVLELENYIKDTIEKETFIYKLESLKIITEDDNVKEVSIDDYKNKTIGEITSLEDVNIFTDIKEINIAYKGDYKPLDKVIELNVKGSDDLHKDIEVIKNEKFKIYYKGELPSDPFKLEGEVVDKDKLKINILPTEGVSSDKDSIEIEFTGYNIEEGSFIEKDTVDDKIQIEIVLLPKTSTLGKIKFENTHNGDSFSLKEFFYKEDKLYFGKLEEENLVEVTDLVEIEYTNRNEKSKLYKDKEIYYNDETKITIKNENLNKFIKTALGDNFEYDIYRTDPIKEDAFIEESFKGGDPSTKTHNIDFSRKNYTVKVNKEAEETFTVMADSKYLIFDDEKIDTVNINGNGIDLKGKKILIKDLKDEDIINIKTKDNIKLEVVNYKVQNKVYGTDANLKEYRKFKGLEGTKLILNPITQNNYKPGDIVTISGNYILADSFEKEIVLEKDLEIPFYFNMDGKIAYRYMYVTKYGDNWDVDLEANDYDIVNMKDEKDKDYKLLVLYKSEILIGDKNSNPNIKPKDYSENNLDLIKLKESIVVEGEEARKLNIPGSEEFSRIEFVSEPVEQIDANTLYIYSYKENVKDYSKSEIEIPINIEFDDDESQNYSGVLMYPRLEEEYKVYIPIPQTFTCYKNVEVNAEYLKKVEGLKEVKTSDQFIEFIVEVKEKDIDKDLFPKIPKESETEDKDDGTGTENIDKKLTRTKRSLDIQEDVEESLDYILIKFSNKDDECVPEEGPFFKKVKLQKAYLNKDNKITNISGDKNYLEIVTMGDTDIQLDLNMDLSEAELKKEVSADNEGKTYRFKPYKENDQYSSLVDKDGQRVKNGEQILGKDIDIIKSSDLKEDENIFYLMYEPIEKPVEKPSSFNYKFKYYYLEYPDNLVPTYGDIIRDKEYEIEEYYKGFTEIYNNYYNWKKRIEELDKNITIYYENNNNLENKDDAIKTLEELKKILNDNNIIYIKKYLKTDLDQLIENLNNLEEETEQTKEKAKDNISKKDLIDEANKLSLSFVSFIEKEGSGKYKLKKYNEDRYFKLDRNNIEISYRDTSQDKDNLYWDIKEDYDDDFYYKGKRYMQYSKIPIIIGNEYNLDKSVMDDFIILNDSDNDFVLKNRYKWNEYNNTKKEINFDENIDNTIPVIYTQRKYKELELTEIDKPDTKPPVKTGKNLDIIIRNVEKKESGEIEVVKIFDKLEYRDLPSYLNSLGWTITKYKNLEYLDDSNQTPALKEGDIKFSDKLVDGKTITMYIDYLGEGNIEEIIMGDYLVLYSELYTKDGEKFKRPIEGIDSYKGQAAVGQTINIQQFNLEDRGFKLLDKNHNIVDNYEDISHVIKENLKDNTIEILYKKVDTIDYEVQYIDEDNKPLAEFEGKLIISDNEDFKEGSKEIKNYKALKENGDFNIKTDENNEKYIEFKEELGYELKEEEKIQRLYKDDVKVMELEKVKDKKDNKYIIRFIYRDAITLALDANGGEFKDDETIKNYNIFKGQIVDEDNLDKASWKNHKFLGWYGKDEKGNLKEEKFDFTKPINESITLYAKWKKKPSGGGETKPEEKPETKPDVDGWYEPSRPEEKPEEEKLNKLDHFAYIKGYPDINVRPEGNITREEVATVFYRLLTDRYRASVLSETNKFPDVDEKRWSNKEISTMANANIIKGYEDGSFRPREEITRAEVAAIAARFDKLESGQKSFSDIEGHWAEKYIRSAAEKGWVKGYEDNSFRPNKKMTRAEFVTLVNGVLERKVREENILEGIKHFKDLERTAWYYEAMIEATHSHIHQEKRLEDGSEVWLEIIEDRNY